MVCEFQHKALFRLLCQFQHIRRPAAMHGNPWLRLLRREVEDLARTLHGDRYVRQPPRRS
jgi:hypothetical protein